MQKVSTVHFHKLNINHSLSGLGTKNYRLGMYDMNMHTKNFVHYVIPKNSTKSTNIICFYVNRVLTN